MKRTIILAGTILALAGATVPATGQQTSPDQQQDMRRGDRDDRGPWQGQPVPPPATSTKVQYGDRGDDRGRHDDRRDERENRRDDRRDNRDDRDGRKDDRRDYREARQDDRRDARHDRRDDTRSYRNYDYDRPDPRYGNYRPERYYRDGSYAPRALGRNDRIYRGGDGRYYCRRNDGTTGLVIGALGGGVLGNVIAPGGSKTLGTILGGGVGALLGRSIDRGGATCR